MLILAALTPLRAQQSYDIMDSHFRGILFPEVYKNLTSVKVDYPGLWIPDRSGVTVGALPGRFTAGAGLSGLYGRVDADVAPASMGVWFGNFNFANSRMDVYEDYHWMYTLDARVFALSGALWATPQRNDVLRGISVAFDTDNIYEHDGNNYGEYLDRRDLFINLTGLIRLSENYHLRVGLHTLSKRAEDPFDIRFDKAKVFTDGFFAGLLDHKMRSLELRAGNSFAINYGGDKSDTVSVALRYAHGRALSHNKHILFLGVRAEADARYPALIGKNAGSFEYINYLMKLTNKGRVARAGLATPVILDVDLIRSLRCILSVAPRAGYTQINPSNAAPDPLHEFKIEMPEAELSVRGLVGEHFDFALKPTLSNNVFIAALEVRYRF